MPPDFRKDPRSNQPPGFRDIQQEDAPAGVINGLLLMIAIAIAVMVGIAAHDLWKKAHRMPKEGQSGEGVLSYPAQAPDRPTAGFSGHEIGTQP